jgi:hypothetical protein
MDLRKSVMTITPEEWKEKQSRGLAAIVQDRPYILTMHEATNQPIYHPVAIVGDESPPESA